LLLTLEAKEATTEVKTESVLSLQGMKNKTMEEIINKWTGELDRCSEQFKIQATDIRRWDAILVENGDKVNLISHLFKYRYQSCIRRLLKLHKLKIELIPH
jgi:Nsp1-like C-terminal region